jgi:DNA mismatch repair protein MutS
MAGAVPDSADTPLMRQYLDAKARHPGCVLFFRLGDFYEMFFEDAVMVARELDLTLTSRDKNKDNPVPMCGVPHHAAARYLQILVERGHKVAICEQVEDPRLARGIVRREVVRIVTPGTVVDEDALDPVRAHHLCAVILERGRAGLSCLDLSTGDFSATELRPAELVDELARLEPREVLLAGADLEPLEARLRMPVSAIGEPVAVLVDRERALGLLEPILEAEGPGGLREVRTLGTLALAAAAEVIRYARETQPTGRIPVHRLAAYQASDHLVLDEATRRNLELSRTLGGERQGSLIQILDETRTAMGGRLLRRWLGAPLRELAGIRRRHDAVEWLVERASLRTDLRALLGEVYDLERLAGRASLGLATPRDLVALRASLDRLPALVSLLGRDRGELAFPTLLAFGEDLCEDVRADIARTLVDDPPANWREGGIARRGLYAELDELLDLRDGGTEEIARIELEERDKSGIPSLKVRYNRVFGYYLEVTRAHLGKVPAEYIRRQTLANAERYTTEALQALERKLLSADERRLRLELEAFESLRKRVGEASLRIAALAAEVARLDVLCALAEVAHVHGYCRPELDDSFALELGEARHPVVERLAAEGRFVPNDLRLDADGQQGAQLVILTGPNMGGKSTVMRQAALIVLIAQAGSFVPARRARIGLCDRLFTRVGASDNLARGESTFMVEMRETATILREATRRSFVILDEIGRGTSTFDGISIAWAVAEDLHDRVGCRAIFATHYHELVALGGRLGRATNLSTAVRERGGEIVFLHQIIEGGASRSYGIEVAKLAGIDGRLITRARSLLGALESGEVDGARGMERRQLSLLELMGGGAAPVAPAAEAIPPVVEPNAVERALLDADLDALSPREAQALLYELRAKLGAQAPRR